MKNKIIQNLFLILFITPFIIISIDAQQIYFVDNQSAKVRKSDNNGSNLTDLIISSIGLYGIAVDITNNKIFYTNVNTDEIFTSAIDGSGAAVLLNNSGGIDGPRGIAIDGVNNKIYWAEVNSGKIKRADYNGSNIIEVITGLSAPVDVGLDIINGKLYWSNNGVGQKKISRSNLDGTSPEVIVIGIDQVGGIEIDAENGKLYWVDFGATDRIYRSNTDGSSTQVLITIGSGSPRGIAIDKAADKLFWSDVVNGSISSANRDGTLPTAIITSLSQPIGISTNFGIALPVELTGFTARQIEDFIELRWRTVTEKDNYGFEIEQAVQNSNSSILNWLRIGFVSGNGNSNSPKEYVFKDENLTGERVQYRLKQIDTDGSFYYSDVVIVQLSLPTEFSLSQNYPNPFNPGTSIKFTLPQSEFVSLKVYDVLGNEIYTLINEYKDAGIYTLDFDASGLSSGVYFYQLKTNKFSKNMKMLLMK